MVDKKEALETINKKLKQAQNLMDECVFIAEEAGVMFELPWGGEGTSQRGMGAQYIPQSADERTIDFFSIDGTTGWQPSAGTC
jgi:hypothetical protein